MENSWFPEGRNSGKILSSTSAEDCPSPLPPEPPDPSLPSYHLAFPSLSPISSTSTSTFASNLAARSAPTSLEVTSTPSTSQNPIIPVSASISGPNPTSLLLLNPRSGTTTVPIATSPVPTTHSSSHPSTTSASITPIPTFPPLTSLLPPPSSHPLSSGVSTVVSTHPMPSSTTLAAKLWKSASKSLTRLAPRPPSSPGSSKLVIPDSVFQEGAKIHQNFIVGRFLGRPPAYTHIQNVLSGMWNKGIKLEIHLNTQSRSMLVRIPNDFIRSKILEKKVGHISDSMFYVYPWKPGHDTELNLEAIPLWVHLKGVLLELMHSDRWSYIAGEIGEPREVDDFTLNLVSVDTTHVKVEADLTKPLPKSVEFTRQDGSPYSVDVEYPWVRPTCANCHELGHISRYCHHLPPPPTSTKPLPSTSLHDPSKSKPRRNQKPSTQSIPNQPVPSSKAIPDPINPPSTLPASVPFPEPDASTFQTSVPTISNQSPPAISTPHQTSSYPLTNQFSLLSSLPFNTSLPPNIYLPFFPSSSIPFFPSSLSDKPPDQPSSVPLSNPDPTTSSLSPDPLLSKGVASS